MSTSFLARLPPSEFLAKAKALGWSESESSSGQFALTKDGKFCHGIEATAAGTVFVGTTGNYHAVSDLAQSIGAVSEDDVGGFVALWDVAEHPARTEGTKKAPEPKPERA